MKGICRVMWHCAAPVAAPPVSTCANVRWYFIDSATVMKWNTLTVVVAAVCLNVLVLISIPNLVVPPPLSAQRAKAVANFIICSIPLLFSLFAIVRSRGRPLASLRWLTVLPALGWIVYSVSILAEALR